LTRSFFKQTNPTEIFGGTSRVRMVRPSRSGHNKFAGETCREEIYVAPAFRRALVRSRNARLKAGAT